ncbi:MAG: DUF4440 domain-containing protein [Imperialibacter sp.]|uniref:hypothetical protein n=1 Tax=Imperialibacter sp. TaxID=2038411 RepID=UPI0032EF2266
MTSKFFYLALFAALCFFCTTQQPSVPHQDPKELKTQVSQLNERLVEAAKDKNINAVIDRYAADAVLMAEYQPVIKGRKSIAAYYTALFAQQQVISYRKVTTELLDFDSTVLEMGTFTKKLANERGFQGKYWNVWRKTAEGDLLLQAETFGFFHPVDDPSEWVVEGLPMEPSSVRTTVELDAYNALMENIVRDRDTETIISLFSEDAAYYPFADTTKTGRTGLHQHYTDYHRPPVTIDSIEVWSYDYLEVAEGIIELSQFYVEWSVPNLSGHTQGTGMRYWKRQPDHSLRLHRMIGLHEYAGN